MTAGDGASVHASAVLIGDVAVLIQGRSGSGKSRLAFDLMLAGRAGQIAPTLLVGDDRVHLERHGGQLLVRPAAKLEGLIEIRGLGIRRCDFVTQAPVGLVVDLDAEDGERMPDARALRTTLMDIVLPRIPVAPGFAPLPLVLAWLVTAPERMPALVCDK